MAWANGRVAMSNRNNTRLLALCGWRRTKRRVGGAQMSFTTNNPDDPEFTERLVPRYDMKDEAIDDLRNQLADERLNNAALAIENERWIARFKLLEDKIDQLRKLIG